MKKITLHFMVMLLTTGSLLMMACSGSKENIPVLLERKKAMGPDAENVAIHNTYNKAKEALKKDPEDMKQYIQLASAFISEGRITGDNNYYSNAAMKMLDRITTAQGVDKDLTFQALSLKSAILLNMHQFKDALVVANQAVAMNSFNAGIFGALVDANVENGNYEEAVKDCDKMMAIRPDLRSYSRASYLRQIFGQTQGAIEAMKMAVEAGLPGSENTEWARTKVADLYLENGNIDSASILYRSSLVYRENYPFALIGMARVERARKNYDGAIQYAKNAIQVLGESSFVAYLADLYELKGDVAKARETRNDVVALLEQSRKEEAPDAPVKHNVSRELATAYLNAGNLDKAMEYALADLKMRPDNIDANELMAWITYLKGDIANARQYADKMMATHTRNAGTLYKAGAIYAAAGDVPHGNELMQTAMTVNPNLDPMITSKVKPALVSIRQ